MLRPSRVWSRMWPPSRAVCSMNALAPIATSRSTSRAWLSYCHAERGAFTEGLAIAEDGLRVAETVNLPFSLIEACSGVGLVCLRQGDVHRAVPVLERALGLCQDWHILSPLTLGGRSLGCGVCPGGACRRGPASSGTRRGAGRRHGESVGLAHTVACLSEVYLLADRCEDAHARAEQAVDLARHTSNAAIRPGRCGSWARVRRARRPQRSRPPLATAARPLPWPRSWGCDRSRPTATGVSAPCMPS